MAVPFNHLNLPAVDASAQMADQRDLQLQEAQKQADRIDVEYDDATRDKNTRFLAGATRVLMDLHNRNPDRFYEAADELGREGIRRGIIDPETWDPQLVTIDKVLDLHDQAMVGLGGKPTNREMAAANSNVPSKVRTAQFYSGLDEQGRADYNAANFAQKAFKTYEVPMPDGSTRTVNYDPNDGTGYDLQGNQIIMRPGGGGQLLAYGEEGLLGPANEIQAPPGLGQSQSPADKKTSELEAQRNFDALKVVEQNLTMMENAFRLEPMMQAALEGANGWNTAWGSLLASMPGSEAKDLASTILTIKANIGFDRLQRMRAENTTGGALGQVAVQELNALQSTIANLDQSQSTGQFKENMKIALNQYQSWRRKWGEAIMKEGTRDQKMRYYTMVPTGQPYMHPDGSWRVKQ